MAKFQSQLYPFGVSAKGLGLSAAVSARLHDEGALTLTWQLSGPLEALAVPLEGAVLPVEQLWAYTCFEVFLRRGVEPAYREFNFSPSGQWIQFDFSSYRNRIPSSLKGGEHPHIEWARSQTGLTLSVRLRAAHLPQGEGALALGMTMVMQLKTGACLYWALAHPPGKPDFHHDAGFACML